MRRIRQRDETDCAAACLAAIAHYYRLELSVSGIRLLAGTGAAGTTVLGVVHAVNVADGKPIWTFKTQSEIKASPVVVGDVVRVGKSDLRVES